MALQTLDCTPLFLLLGYWTLFLRFKIDNRRNLIKSEQHETTIHVIGNTIYGNIMGKKFRVTRLEELAFTAAYKDILSNLLLCPHHRPEDKRNLNSYSSLISLNPFLTSQNILNYVRNRLDQHLVGIMNDDIKKRLVIKFNQSIYDSTDKTDLWPFYDCVLDNSFTELETHVVFPWSHPNERFIQSIALRSPNISQLSLDFDLVAKRTDESKIIPIIKSLSKFASLINLSLCNLSKHHRSILSWIGSSCPTLKRLVVTGFHMNDMDIVSLVVGENLDSLPPLLKEICLNKKKDAYEMLELVEILPEELVTPLCRSLQELRLEDVEDKMKLFKSCEYSDLSASVVAFALRHLSNLCRFDHYSSSTSSAVTILAKSFDEIRDESEGIKGLENLRQLAKKIGLDATPLCTARPNSSSLIPFSHSGVLKLTSIDFVNINCLETMKCVGKTCPLLKEVVFSQSNSDEDVPNEKLSSILSTDWPKIERVTFVKVSSRYRQIVLSSIGSQLQRVTFVSCEAINIDDLTPCNQLKTLQIYFSSSVIDLSKDLVQCVFRNRSQDFLPSLNRFESDICLGETSAVFEEKSTLTHLELDCCHVNTKGDTTDWNEIARYWQRVQTLRIRRCTGLNMKIVKSLSHQLPKLKELTLPRKSLNSKREREECNELKDYFKNGPLKISVEFDSSESTVECPFQIQPTPYESSDEEIESNSSDSFHLRRGLPLQFGPDSDYVIDDWLDEYQDDDDSPGDWFDDEQDEDDDFGPFGDEDNDYDDGW